jgi:hypothetical protein
MIRAIYRDGAIQPLDELPSTWHDGQELVVAEHVGAGVIVKCCGRVAESGGGLSETNTVFEGDSLNDIGQ